MFKVAPSGVERRRRQRRQRRRLGRRRRRCTSDVDPTTTTIMMIERTGSGSGRARREDGSRFVSAAAAAEAPRALAHFRRSSLQIAGRPSSERASERAKEQHCDCDRIQVGSDRIGAIRCEMKASIQLRSSLRMQAHTLSNLLALRIPLRLKRKSAARWLWRQPLAPIRRRTCADRKFKLERARTCVAPALPVRL